LTQTALRGYNPGLIFYVIDKPGYGKGVEQGKKHGGRTKEIEVWGYPPFFFLFEINIWPYN